MSATAVPQTEGVLTRECHSFKASPVSPSHPIADLVLIFDREPPNPPGMGKEWFEEYQRAYIADAHLVESELFSHLPGGLYDQILCAMLARKASLLKISHEGRP